MTRTAGRLVRLVIAGALTLVHGFLILWDIARHWIHRKEIP